MDLNQAIQLVLNRPGVRMGRWEIRPAHDPEYLRSGVPRTGDRLETLQLLVKWAVKVGQRETPCLMNTP